MSLTSTLQALASGMGADVKSLTARSAASGTGFRNKLINASFLINQRGFSGGALAAGNYGHDRWKAGAGGCTYSFVVGLPDTYITVTGGTILQVIEACHVEGGTYTASWAGTAQARIVQGGSPGAFANSPITVTNLTAGVAINTEYANGSVLRPQTEAGAIATPFARRSIVIEQLLAARYCRLAGRSAKIVAIASTAFDMTCEFGYPEMRAAPSIALLVTSPTVTRAGVGNLGLSFGSIIDAASSRQGFRLFANLGYGSLAQGESFTSLTDDIILATAEL